jgi:hypothetical protein
MQGCSSKLAASFSFPNEFCLMYVARIGLAWHFFGIILETDLLTSAGLQKTSQLVDSPGMKTAQSPCLLSQVEWTVRVPPTRLDLAVFRDSHAGKQSLMKHSRTVPICFAQKPGQSWSPSGPSSCLSENDPSCMQCIDWSHVIYPRSKMPFTQGPKVMLQYVAIRSLELPR